MTPEEMTFWKEAIKTVCTAWVIGTIFISIGIGSISIKNIFNHKDQSK